MPMVLFVFNCDFTASCSCVRMSLVCYLSYYPGHHSSCPHPDDVISSSYIENSYISLAISNSCLHDHFSSCPHNQGAMFDVMLSVSPRTSPIHQTPPRSPTSAHSVSFSFSPPPPSLSLSGISSQFCVSIIRVFFFPVA